MIRPALLWLLLGFGGLGPTAIAQVPAQEAQAIQGSAVGVPAWKRDLVIMGSEVEVAPTDNRSPMVLRIAQVFPHGSGFRYDIEYYGLEPGAYNLLDFLRCKDGSSLDGIEPVGLVIESSLSPGTLRPNALESGAVPSVGGYSLSMTLLGVMWVLGLVAIITVGRKRTAGASDARQEPRTIADRLRPLVEQGLAGHLSAEDSAQLELTLIAFWRRKLGLHDGSTAEALRQLKEDPQAGPLLRQLELWLHSPDKRANVDPAELLAPYRNLDAAEFEPPLGTHVPA